MAHVVSGKLRKAPFIKEGCGQGDSTMYVVELSEMVKDWQTQEKQYANYKAMFFAKTDGAKEFYHKAFAEGSFVVVSCEKLKVDTFAADNGSTYVTLNMDNPRLESALPVSDMGVQQQRGWGQSQQPQQMQQAPQQRQAPQQQAPQQQYNEPPMDFDDDIPFAPIGLQHGRNFIHSI